MGSDLSNYVTGQVLNVDGGMLTQNNKNATITKNWPAYALALGFILSFSSPNHPLALGMEAGVLFKTFGGGVVTITAPPRGRISYYRPWNKKYGVQRKATNFFEGNDTSIIF